MICASTTVCSSLSYGNAQHAEQLAHGEYVQHALGSVRIAHCPAKNGGGEWWLVGDSPP